MANNDQPFCRLADLETSGAWGHTVEGHSVFVVKTSAGLRGWLNQCPHQGIELNWQPHQFWDTEKQYLQCSMHGALFLPATGECILGPCQGQALKPVAVRIEDDLVFVQLPTTGT